MLGIQIQGEFLELLPGTVIQLERNNPFLQLNESVTGSYSFPFTVKNTPLNNRLLNYGGVLQVEISNTGIDAIIFDNGLPLYKGKIKIEKTQHNLNGGSGDISCYFLTDISDFMQDAKGKNVKDADYGGPRQFQGAVNIWASTFGDHILDVMNGAPGAYDYAFFPVANNQWGDDPGPAITVMNNCRINGGGDFQIELGGVYVPFPYLKYVLEKIAAYTGWTFAGDVLTDADFEKITLINFRSINWGKCIDPAGNGGLGSFVMHGDIFFDIKDHVPDMEIPAFMLALKNRFGWWYDVDNNSKTITIKKLSDLVTVAVEDNTADMLPLVTKTILQESRLYALRCTDGFGGGNLTADDPYQGVVANVAALPTAAVGNVGHIYFVAHYNTYYICEQTGSSTYAWAVLTANMYDYVPANATEEISTVAGTVGMKDGVSATLTLIPELNSLGVFEGTDDVDRGIHLCYFHGMQPKGPGSPDEYPYGSSHVYSPDGSVLANVALTYLCYLNDGTPVGLYDINWAAFLNLLTTTEELEGSMLLVPHRYMQLGFGNMRLVGGVRMFLKTISAQVPYNGRVEVAALRV